MNEKAEIECPCCHGEKVLIVYDGNDDLRPFKAQCTHCQGAGVIYGDNRSNNRYE